MFVVRAKATAECRLIRHRCAVHLHNLRMIPSRKRPRDPKPGERWRIRQHWQHGIAFKSSDFACLALFLNCSLLPSATAIRNQGHMRNPSRESPWQAQVPAKASGGTQQEVGGQAAGSTPGLICSEGPHPALWTPSPAHCPCKPLYDTHKAGWKEKSRLWERTMQPRPKGRRNTT